MHLLSLFKLTLFTFKYKQIGFFQRVNLVLTLLRCEITTYKVLAVICCKLFPAFVKPLLSLKFESRMFLKLQKLIEKLIIVPIK